MRSSRESAAQASEGSGSSWATTFFGSISMMLSEVSVRWTSLICQTFFDEQLPQVRLITHSEPRQHVDGAGDDVQLLEFGNAGDALHQRALLVTLDSRDREVHRHRETCRVSADPYAVAENHTEALRAPDTLAYRGSRHAERTGHRALRALRIGAQQHQDLTIDIIEHDRVGPRGRRRHQAAKRGGGSAGLSFPSTWRHGPWVSAGTDPAATFPPQHCTGIDRRGMQRPQGSGMVEQEQALGKAAVVTGTVHGVGPAVATALEARLHEGASRRQGHRRHHRFHRGERVLRGSRRRRQLVNNADAVIGQVHQLVSKRPSSFSRRCETCWPEPLPEAVAS